MADVQLSSLGPVIAAAYESVSGRNAFTDAQVTKLTALTNPNLGAYASLAALQAAHPTPPAGSYAVVDGGASVTPELYVFSTETNSYRTTNPVVSVAGLNGEPTAAQLVAAIEATLLDRLDTIAPSWRGDGSPAASTPNTLTQTQSTQFVDRGGFN